jgi:hypothetical protein
MTSRLYEILEARSAPGLPGGPVPFGKSIRDIADQDDDLMFDEGNKGSSPIVKLSLSTSNTAAHEDGVDNDAESTEGTDSTEGKSETEAAGTGSDDAEGSSIHFDSSTQDSNYEEPDESVETESDDDVETEVDREWLSEVERVLRRHVAHNPGHLIANPRSLIVGGVFHELNRNPTVGEVEEAQCRILGVED